MSLDETSKTTATGVRYVFWPATGAPSERQLNKKQMDRIFDDSDDEPNPERTAMDAKMCFEKIFPKTLLALTPWTYSDPHKTASNLLFAEDFLHQQLGGSRDVARLITEFSAESIHVVEVTANNVVQLLARGCFQYSTSGLGIHTTRDPPRQTIVWAVVAALKASGVTVSVRKYAKYRGSHPEQTLDWHQAELKSATLGATEFASGDVSYLLDGGFSDGVSLHIDGVPVNAPSLAAELDDQFSRLSNPNS